MQVTAPRIHEDQNACAATSCKWIKSKGGRVEKRVERKDCGTPLSVVAVSLKNWFDFLFSLGFPPIWLFSSLFMVRLHV